MHKDHHGHWDEILPTILTYNNILITTIYYHLPNWMYMLIWLSNKSDSFYQSKNAGESASGLICYMSM